MERAIETHTDNFVGALSLLSSIGGSEGSKTIELVKDTYKAQMDYLIDKSFEFYEHEDLLKLYHLLTQKYQRLKEYRTIFDYSLKPSTKSISSIPYIYKYTLKVDLNTLKNFTLEIGRTDRNLAEWSDHFAQLATRV